MRKIISDFLAHSARWSIDSN
jgi:uncharacterized DUF497 family protein